MKIIQTKLSDVLIIEPDVYPDNRGYFSEFYNKQKLKAQGFDHDFIQDNIASSTRGVLRGLHFQYPPKAETKVIRCVIGSIWDVIVDIRNNSETFGKWYGTPIPNGN